MAVTRMWPDLRAAELLYRPRRRIFPIMHVLVVRRALVDATPTLLLALYTAFDRARVLAAADLATRDFSNLTLPWLSGFAAEAHAERGGDPWTYAIDANRDVLETMLCYAVADALAPLGLTVANLFA